MELPDQMPEGCNFYGLLHTALTPEAVAQRFATVGWGVTRSDRQESLETSWGRLTLVAGNPIIVQGWLDRPDDCVGEVLGLLSSPEIDGVYQWINAEGRLWRELPFDASMLDPDDSRLPADIKASIRASRAGPAPAHVLRKRWWLWVIGLLLILGIGTAVSPLRYTVRGWLTGESFSEGWPISYWVDALADQDPSVRQHATSALAWGGPKSEYAVPALVAALDDPKDEVRWGAASALGEIGRRAEQAVPALRKMLSSRSAADRTWAALGIGLFGPDAEAAVPDLIERLADDAPRVRGNAAWALGRIGPGARASVPKLRERAEDGTGFESRPFVQTVGEMACAALWRIDPAYAREEDIPQVAFPWDRFGKDRGR